MTWVNLLRFNCAIMLASKLYAITMLLYDGGIKFFYNTLLLYHCGKQNSGNVYSIEPLSRNQLNKF